MKVQSSQTILITGASGGLGTYISRAFAQRGLKLALVAFPGDELEELCKTLQKGGANAFSLASDLRDPAQRREVVERTLKEFGQIDILVNNAGVEFTSPFDELSEENITEVMRVNLEAALIMTRLVLPGMLKRRSGHIVNISSLAGKSGPALQEPYAATKAGLIGFTFSLRASYRTKGVSASVIVPGFVETGIYSKLKERSGLAAPALLGTSQPEKVVNAVMRALDKDLCEILVNPLPVRPLLALLAMFPSLGEWLVDKTGGNDFFRRVFAASKKNAA